MIIKYINNEHTLTPVNNAVSPTSILGGIAQKTVLPKFLSLGRRYHTVSLLFTYSMNRSLGSGFEKK